MVNEFWIALSLFFSALISLITGVLFVPLSRSNSAAREQFKCLQGHTLSNATSNPNLLLYYLMLMLPEESAFIT